MTPRTICLTAGLVLLLTAAAAQPADPGQWLIIEPVGDYPRAPIHMDPIEEAVVTGRWGAPKAGDEVQSAKGKTCTWRTAQPGDDGWLKDEALEGGYACWLVPAEHEQIAILEAAGHSLVYVNGVPRAGDVYSTGYVRLPVKIQQGTNALLFPVGRGQVRARLLPADSAAKLNPDDATTPDVIRGLNTPYLAALPVLNLSEQSRDDLVIEATVGNAPPRRTSIPAIGPLALRKAAFEFAYETTRDEQEIELRLRLVAGASDQVLDTATLKINVRHPDEKHKRTFVSAIDGSVQYYAVTPAHPEAPTDKPLALFLSLHGAAVEATNQANAYQHKTWGHIVAPTNRRPYGFDWEDIGRVDALEVLEEAKRLWKIDPQRVYLTGHSMGGHGTWQVGATCPDLFAAIAPSAGWVDVFSYANNPRTEEHVQHTSVEDILDRARGTSRTTDLARNYLHYGIYVLHGDADDNVPVTEARRMRGELGQFHPDFCYYEKPGAGHWWGAECVDWPPLFEFLRQHVKPAVADVLHIEFHTANPAVSSHSDWIAITGQQRLCDFSSVVADLDAAAREFTIKTTNVQQVVLNLGELARPHQREGDGKTVDSATLPDHESVNINIDDHSLKNIPWPEGGSGVELNPMLWLEQDGTTWRVVRWPPPSRKGSHRYGPFKHVFNHRVIFVYGTRGSAEENAAAYNKARYDAETFWYRGNASVDVLPDTALTAAEFADRNVILYGNSDVNAAWSVLLADSPVQVRRGVIRVGDREFKGDDLGCLVLRPRKDSDVALVAAVAGTGLVGQRVLERMPLLVTGIAYPDCLVVGPDVLSRGTAGIRAAGFFGLDWTVDHGDFVWGD